MMATRIAALAALAVGTAVSLAAPASAELLDGTYDYTDSHGAAFTITFTSCGAGCKRAEYFGTQMPDPIKEYRLDGNTWTWPDTQYNGATTIDNNTLTMTSTAEFMGKPLTASGQLVKVS